jgi:hypothetical protein
MEVIVSMADKKKEKVVAEEKEIVDKSLETEETEIEKSETKIEPEETETKEKTDESSAEMETENIDPWKDWSDVISELNDQDTSEKAMQLTEADVVRIVREQLKLWVKGVNEGKYPMPKSESKEPSKYPYPEKKDLEDMKSQITDTKKYHDDTNTKLETLSKSIEDIKEELQMVKDTPIEVVEKSLKKEKEYEPFIMEGKDGSITRRR